MNVERNIVRGRHWRVVRKRVLERDGYRCRKCGKAGRLEVHHVVSVYDGGRPFHDDNLITLCRGCHVEIHGQRYRGGKAGTPTDVKAWREYLRGA